jgi:hypothetical protein
MKEIGLVLILAIMLLFLGSATNGEVARLNKFNQISTGLGLIQNDSTITGCAETDNINILLYSKNLTAFRIIATHPTYIPTIVEDEGANCSNCKPPCISHFATFDAITNQTVKEWPFYNTTDGNVVINVVYDIPWRPHPQTTMNVSVEGKYDKDVVYFVIYKHIEGKHIEGKEYWPQVFVLYQDGNARIKPQRLPCLDDTTFDSSVIIGATEYKETQLVNISSVVIDPTNLTMDIKYRDNTSAHIKMQVNCIENIVEVSNITYDTTSHYFARLRSMWIGDGNADVDHIRTENEELPIMGGWTERKGTWWQFFRKVPSIHNTYGPDIRIEIVPEKEKIPG